MKNAFVTVSKPLTNTPVSGQFNWWTHLQNAAVRMAAGTFTTSELVMMRSRAASWITCAVGEQCAVLPRNEFDSYAPLDEVLRDLGCTFYDCVRHCDWHKATATLHQIEQRTGQLLWEMGVAPAIQLETKQ